jgi:hypothetical protein
LKPTGNNPVLPACSSHSFWCLIILLKWKILLKLKPVQKLWPLSPVKPHAQQGGGLGKRKRWLLLTGDWLLRELKQKLFESNDKDSDKLCEFAFGTRIIIL